MIGQTIAHYKVLDKLGEGGMGVVYRAEDTKLDRQVALKVLPAELAESPERLERFQREAKALAALDHANIVTIYSVEQAGECHFLTMQLIEGESLSELIPPGGLSLGRFLELAVPLADALSAAHEKGVVHRDLKPGNIMVTGKGQVKVLDFGLAKLRQTSQSHDLTQLPTEPLTAEGLVVGTLQYMSPEQLEGRATIDFRSDIFSLGVILYEMATGQRAFKGDSQAALIAAILTAEPAAVTERVPDAPPLLDHLIRKCLAKQPDTRWHSARDLAGQLEWIATSKGEVRQATAGHRQSVQRQSSSTGEYQIEYFTSLDGASIAAARGGSGKPLVVIPALIDTIEASWTKYSQAFPGRELVLYDRRGFGLSERESAPGKAEPYLQDALTVVDGYGLDEFDLLGTLAGTVEAAAVAARERNRVSHLVLRSPVLSFGDWVSIPPVQAALAALQRDWAFFTESFSQLVVGWGNPDAPRMAKHLREITSQAEFQSVVDGLVELDLKAIFAEIEVPTLVEHHPDYFFPNSYSRHIASLISDCRMQIFSGATNDFLRDLSQARAFLGGEE